MRFEYSTKQCPYPLLFLPLFSFLFSSILCHSLRFSSSLLRIFLTFASLRIKWLTTSHEWWWVMKIRDNVRKDSLMRKQNRPIWNKLAEQRRKQNFAHTDEKMSGLLLSQLNRIGRLWLSSIQTRTRKPGGKYRRHWVTAGRLVEWVRKGSPLSPGHQGIRGMSLLRYFWIFGYKIWPVALRVRSGERSKSPPPN